MKMEEAEARLAAYRKSLQDFRTLHGQEKINTRRFFLLGLGDREKLVYEDGALKTYPLGRVIQSFRPDKDVILPAERRVAIFAGGREYEIFEDNDAVWMIDGEGRHPVKGTEIPMELPDFAGYPYPMICRVLYDEILFNIIAGRPTPSYGHYRTPWYRDGAMIAMCLRRFGHLGLIRDWILGLDSPYDFNRGAHIREPDNLGQALYLLSTVSDKNHPLVPKILAEMKHYEVRESGGVYLDGVTDGSAHPLYITKWAKYGLNSLGLADPYCIPADIADSYSCLFWMAYTDADEPGENISSLWPYLTWASSHYHGKRENCPISDRDFPLTWEGQPDFSPLTCPHTWHSAEALLYLTSKEYLRSEALSADRKDG